MRWIRRSILVAAVIAVAAFPAMTGAVGGLQGPLFGLATAPNGDILVADNSTGILVVRDDEVIGTIPLDRVTAVAPIGAGQMWVTTGPTPPNGLTDTGQALYRVSRGQARHIANLFEAEQTLNPDGMHIESNPYAVHALGGSSALVADAAGNSLLRVHNRGTVDVVAAFPNDENADTAPLKALLGCPNEAVAFFCGLPDVRPVVEPVPTSIAVGPDGYWYIGELKGIPAPIGDSIIWRITPGSSSVECPGPDCVKLFDGGFTSIIDLTFGPDGRLYVAEMDEHGWIAGQTGFGSVGGKISSCDVVTLACDEVMAGIPQLTAITFGKDGTLWATRHSLVPGSAEVFAVAD